MKKRLKLMAVMLAVVLALGMLTACGASAGQSSDPGAQASETQTPESEAPESETPETEAPEEETYTFEGPGIFEVADVPESYKEAAAQQGTVEKFVYNNGTEDKYFNIYLPYGYDSGADSYNVVYLIHGGGAGSPENFIRTDESTNLQKTVDNMIQNGEVEPFILVAPTWRAADTEASEDGSYGSENGLTEAFAKNELTQYVIPAVDENFRTNATREGRVFSGFSMGGVTTWYTFLYDMDYFKYFIPMSGDCWVVEETGGASKPAETVAALEDAVSAQGYTGEDFVLYACTGKADYALPNMAPQIYAMQDSDLFVFGENTYFGLHASAAHGDPWARTYLYNVLPLLWKD